MKTARAQHNYRLMMDESIASLGGIAKLALHSCCGPCSTSCILELSPHFEITVFYYNPNIDTRAEYEKRAAEQRRVVEQMPTPNPVRFVDAQYGDSDEFMKVARKFAGEKEGGDRCTACYALRLERTARFAEENGIPWMTSTLSVSPMKDAERINSIGDSAARRHGISWLWSDFKKKNGYQQSIALSREYDLYRQEYCGCIWSHEERLEQIRKKEIQADESL